MDRYEGFGETFTAEEINEQAALDAAIAEQMLQERRQWEGERDAIAEYESWYLQAAINDAHAEYLSERGA